MKYFKHIARIIVGLTFIFSGFVKGIDPWGSAYKFSDYFLALHLDWFLCAAFPLGVLLAFTEFLIGVSLLFNKFLRFFSWLALLFMIFFTGLTLWIAIENPVSDCGCFGDALVLTNWQTFYKNLVLIVLTISIFRNRNNMEIYFKRKTSSTFYYLAIILYFVVTIYSFNHLPIFDFRPYKIGVNIPKAMKIPEGAPTDEYNNIFYYKNFKTEKIKKFTEKNYPWQDTINWQFYDMESVLTKKGYTPPIHDFRIETSEGDNVIDFFIYDKNYVLILIAYDLKQSNTKSQEKINTLAKWAQKEGISFICLTASLPDEILNFINKYNATYEFFNCDEITLKTIIRSNPGLMVIKDGIIKAKYHYNDIPSPKEFNMKFINK